MQVKQAEIDISGEIELNHLNLWIIEIVAKN